MQPFSRETVIDRRQPAVRWTAVLAGAAFAIGIWLVLQLLGSGIALHAIEPTNVDDAHGSGIGSSAWSVFAVAFAMFAGGMVAARLAGHHERRVAGAHGLLVWAFTTLAGVVIVSAAVAIVAPSVRAEATVPAPGTRMAIVTTLEPINVQLSVEGKPVLTPEVVMEAARHSITVDGYDRARFIRELDDRTPLNRTEVEQVARQLGDRFQPLVFEAAQLGNHRLQAVRFASAAGCVFLVAALALILGAAAAIGGSLLVAHDLVRRHHFGAPTHTTAPYPIPPIPADIDDGEL